MDSNTDLNDAPPSKTQQQTPLQCPAHCPCACDLDSGHEVPLSNHVVPLPPKKYPWSRIGLKLFSERAELVSVPPAIGSIATCHQYQTGQRPIQKQRRPRQGALAIHLPLIRHSSASKW